MMARGADLAGALNAACGMVGGCRARGTVQGGALAVGQDCPTTWVAAEMRNAGAGTTGTAGVAREVCAMRTIAIRDQIVRSACNEGSTSR